jgi:hypothetical protein
VPCRLVLGKAYGTEGAGTQLADDPIATPDKQSDGETLAALDR